MSPSLRGAAVWLVLASATLSSCVMPPFAEAELRIVNEGQHPIPDFVVVFPDSETAFSDVPASWTTDYRAVPGGVYRYAAYRFTVDGDTKTQPVVDWVGEDPLDARKVTYTIEFGSDADSGMRVTLLNVTVDEPRR